LSRGKAASLHVAHLGYGDFAVGPHRAGDVERPIVEKADSDDIANVD